MAVSEKSKDDVSDEHDGKRQVKRDVQRKPWEWFPHAHSRPPRIRRPCAVGIDDGLSCRAQDTRDP